MLIAISLFYAIGSVSGSHFSTSIKLFRLISVMICILARNAVTSGVFSSPRDVLGPIHHLFCKLYHQPAAYNEAPAEDMEIGLGFHVRGRVGTTCLNENPLRGIFSQDFIFLEVAIKLEHKRVNKLVGTAWTE